jgi:hypothetical protein
MLFKLVFKWYFLLCVPEEGQRYIGCGFKMCVTHFVILHLAISYVDARSI